MPTTVFFATNRVAANADDAINGYEASMVAPSRPDAITYLKTPLIYQTGPKTSAKRGCSCSIWEKRCINGRSQSSRMVGMRS